MTKNITESKIDASNDWRGFAEELKKESPRAAVILGASFLDIKLRELIASFLIDNRVVDSLLGGIDGGEAPLSTFSSRTKLAYCLGLLTKDEYDDLNMIRKIRNEFAHKLHNLSFDDQKVVEWCNSLKLPKYLGYGKMSHAILFRVGVALLAAQLDMAAKKALLNRLAVPGNNKWDERLKVVGVSLGTT